MKIELTKGKFVEIDDEDEEKILWWPHPEGKQAAWWGRDRPQKYYASAMHPKKYPGRYIYAEKRLTKTQARYINNKYPGILRPKSDGSTTLNLLMHRLIVEAQWNEIVDHIDGNTLNCKKSNLRKGTFAQNCQNRKKRADSNHNYIGIVKTQSNKYRAHIRPGSVTGNGQDQKRMFGPSRKTQKEAAQDRDKLAIKYFGSSARLNFPEQFSV